MNNKIDLKKIVYLKLNSRQQENYNYQKISSILADYGYNTMRLSDDWNGADFLAVHVNGKDFLKIQLKTTLTFAKKYEGKNLWVCFPFRGDWFLYPHDELFNELSRTLNFHNTLAFRGKKGEYHWPTLGEGKLSMLAKYKL